MASINRDLRNALEKACTKARSVAEASAQRALRGLAVGDREAHRSMPADQQALRNRLRAHGRQLGDKRNVEKGTQETERLASECAYEQWHRMLFARFLAENALLIEPESGVAISVEEVKELSRERGVDWLALAGELAVRMLPQVFRLDDPVLEVQFAPEDRKQLEERLQSLPPEVFLASDALGWSYQFWQTERKREVNDSGVKIGAEELSAVTQLFTEDYMVDFLLDNTLGAWHAGKVLAANPKLAETAQSEDELRQAVLLPECSWRYLRFIKGQDDKWIPAAGTFDGWPKAAKELTCLDPCMGSGHFVVALFERLVALLMAEEKLAEKAAVAAVIRDNLFGLELDPRCTQIGAFNLALSAWRRVGYCALPAMNLACSGLAPNMREADWLAIAGDNENLQRGMERLYRLFQKAAVLGSLINPRASEGDLLVAAFHELQPLLERALAQDANDDTAHEMAVTARGLAKAAEILAGQFTLVATNVPYLGRGKQEEVLQDYCEQVYPDGKADLATSFIDRCFDFCATGGTTGLVTIQSFLYQGIYEDLRERLLGCARWDSLAKLGPRAFGSIGGEMVNVCLVSLSRVSPRQEHKLYGVDVADERTPADKAAALSTNSGVFVVQAAQRENPDSRVSLDASSELQLLDNYADSYKGFSTGDWFRFTQAFWEQPRVDRGWVAYALGDDKVLNYGGRRQLVFWEDGDGQMSSSPGCYIKGTKAWGKRGVSVSQISLTATIYTGEIFHENAAAIVPKQNSHLLALWAFLQSSAYREAVRGIDESLKVTNLTLAKVPFDLAHWQTVAAEKYPHGLPKPFSSDLTQWLFNGHPAGADQPLQVAVARLLGYRWPRQTGSSFPDCPALAPDSLEELADDDGIVPISPAKGEGPAAERLRALLACSSGDKWKANQEAELLAGVGHSGKSLDDWLRHRFFEQHCTVFHQRPFVWHIWDGLTDGFHALINYHQLCASEGGGRRALDKLTHTYLGDWIVEQRAAQKAGKESADGRLTAALHLQEQLKLILDGEPPFDLFVRWRPLHEQAIGWEPDINDGVRMNIRPFMAAKTLNGKSIFRKAPKIKWDKDRGKEPERAKQDFPWFWSRDGEHTDFMGGRVLDGVRWNDLHYSNVMKRAARDAAPRKRR